MVYHPDVMVAVASYMVFLGFLILLFLRYEEVDYGYL